MTQLSEEFMWLWKGLDSADSKHARSVRRHLTPLTKGSRHPGLP